MVYDKLKIQNNRNKISNKAVLKPWVSPAFAITYFCNHCHIRFENTSIWIQWPFFSKTWTKGHGPKITCDPSLLRSHVWLYPRIIVSKSNKNTSKYVVTVTLFAKTWTKGHWPLDDLWPHVCWGHMCDSTQGSLCPIPMYVDGNTSMYVDTVINFAKYRIHTTYIHIQTVHTTYRMSDYIVSYWTQFRRDKNVYNGKKFCFISFIWCQKLTCKIESNNGLLQLLLSESSCVVLNYLSSTLILKLSPVVNAVILVNQTKEI